MARKRMPGRHVPGKSQCLLIVHYVDEEGKPVAPDHMETHVRQAMAELRAPKVPGMVSEEPVCRVRLLGSSLEKTIHYRKA